MSIEYQKAFLVHLHLKDMTIHVYCNERFFNTKTTATTLSRCVISIVQCNSRAFTSLRWRPLKCQFYKFPVAYTCNLQWTTKNRILIKIPKSLKVPAWLNWSREHKTSPFGKSCDRLIGKGKNCSWNYSIGWTWSGQYCSFVNFAIIWVSNTLVIPRTFL